jgi:hypothetical protein
MTTRILRAVTSAATVWFVVMSTTNAFAGAKDFEFQPVSVDVKNGDGADLAVRLVNKVTGKPVDGAVLFRTRLDMAPNAMAEMEAKHVAQPSTEPGVYRFKADLTMAGQWGLKIMAKVPGEPDTVEGTVVFKAKD